MCSSRKMLFPINPYRMEFKRNCNVFFKPLNMCPVAPLTVKIRAFWHLRSVKSVEPCFLWFPLVIVSLSKPWACQVLDIICA